MAHVTAVNISEKKGVRKHEVPYIDVKCHHGIVGDAHAGDWHRQISLLADESVDTMREACPIELDAGILQKTSIRAALRSRRCPSARACAWAKRNLRSRRSASSATTTARSRRRRASA